MTKKIMWRLKEQPNSENLRELVKDGILTKDEAREILFSSQDTDERDNESLKSEIKFLRDLVEKLSQNRSQIITTIKEVEVPYRRWPWYERYDYWCKSGGNDIMLCNNKQLTNCDFKAINTFN